MHAIRLINFKGFKDSGWIEFKPLTLIYGYNASGKSSILKALLLLKQSLGNNPTESLRFAASDGVDLGNYEDIVYNHKILKETPIEVHLQIETDNLPKFFKQQNDTLISRLKNNELVIQIQISYDNKIKANYVSLFKVTLSSNSESILSLKKANSSLKNRVYILQSIFYKDNLETKVNIGFNGFIPTVVDEEMNRFNLEDPLGLLLLILHYQTSNYFQRLSNVGPLRSHPSRIQLFTGGNPDHVGSNGNGTYEILYHSRYKDNKLQQNLNKWLNKYNFELDWKVYREGLCEFKIKNRKTDTSVSLVDTGFGLSQIIPIVVELIVCDGGLIIEQPEIHLHSKMQLELGDLFIEHVKKRDKPLIIETHSENILLRVRRRIAENCLKQDGKLFTSDKLAVYFISNDGIQSIVHKVNIDKYGDLQDTPKEFDEFFSDSFQEVMEISKISFQNKQECLK
ncbi:MAG: AAA family ATPase [Sphingobacteriaceae bacterium]|nr:AAA family ATPase [Sphingobacteriaceae bacterium]